MKKLTLILIALLGVVVIGTAQNYALQFDGTDDYVNCGSAMSSSIAGQAFTVEAWIYPTEPGTYSYDYTIFANNSNDEKGVTFRYGGGKLNFTYGYNYDASTHGWSSATTTGVVLTEDTWQHVAAVQYYDAGAGTASITLYVNGTAVASTTAGTIASTITASPNNVVIGKAGNANLYYMQGNIDEVRVWTTARTATEIEDNMNSSLTGSETGLLAYYKMNEGTGTTTADNSTTSYDGTLVGVPTWVEGIFPIIYVDADATGGTYNGTTWATAYQSLQYALDVAVTRNQIWVAEGTYKPSVDADGNVNANTRLHTFQMKNGVSIYGGFAVGETAVSERQIGTNETILSGDIGTVGTDTDNCYHVFYHPDGLGLTNSAILDGFTVTKGNANGISPHDNGGGMYNNKNNPTIRNVLFSSNYSYHGAAIYATSTTPSSLVIINSVFINNSSYYGGSIYSYNNHLSITNCTFANSSAIDYGGAMEFLGNGYVLTAKNCIFWGNTAGQGANAQIYNGATANYYNCDIEGSGGSSSWNSSQLGTDGTNGTGDGNNIDANPLFAGAQNPSHPYSLTGASPCVDVGLSSANSETYDIRGADFGRDLNKTTGAVSTDKIDMGAYEYKFGTDPLVPGFFVDADATSGANSGVDWANAFTSFQSGLDAATIAGLGSVIWVATGTYYPSSAYLLTNTSRYFHFEMINGVSIYGGFNGTETTLAGRDITANVTILSGDIGTTDDDSDNCYHVFYHPVSMDPDLDNTAILDGFTITKGNANSNSTHAFGGGFYNNSNSPTIINCTINYNNSDDDGAAIYNDHSAPKLVSCIFNSNSAGAGGYDDGGAVCNFTSTPSFTNCLFTNNTASHGGAVHNNSSAPTFTNCTFTGNTARNDGGAMSNESRGDGNPIIKNSIFWGNSDPNSKEIYNKAPVVPVISYSNISGTAGAPTGDAGNNIDANPLFVDVSINDYRLTSLSPCADVGLDAANIETYDIRGDDYGRKLLKTNYLTTGTIDMGAYEFNSNTDPSYNTPNWTGDIGTDFTDAGNWDGGVPNANTNVRIPDVTTNDPVIGAAQTADCNNLTIESGANLTLQSIADGSTGSLIINGTLSNSGTITSQRYFPGTTLLNWHMVSAPVSGMGIAASGFAPTSGDFYAWDEPTPGTWVNYKNTTTAPTFATVNGGNNFVAGKGYLLAFNEANPTHNFVGNLNVGNQTFTLKNSAGKDYTYSEGWNLIGNPYSSAIDWNLVSNRSLFVDDFAYAYNPAANSGSGAFEEIDGSSANAYIAANQGFFVIAKSSSNNSQFTFTNAIQTHGGGTYYKNKSEDEKLVLRFSGEQYYDETTIRKRDESTFNKDRVDAFKMNSFNVNTPNIYTISNDEINLATNSIPYIDASNNIKVGVVVPKTGLYTISVIEASNYMMDHNVYLEDKLLNTLNKISESDYTFTSDAGDIRDRFVIHFGVLGVDEPINQPALVHVWASNNTLNIYNTNNYTGNIKVVNMFGQTVINTKLNGDNNQQLRVDVPTGYYIVNIITNKGVVNKKVYLR